MTTAVRNVTVRLSAETSSYIAKMQGAGKATEDAMGKSERASKKASIGLTDVEKAGAGAALLLAGKAVMAAADFDEAMSSVQAATMESASSMEALREAALQAGADTSFSATEAAAGIENLAKAGVSTADILGGALTGSLDLAAAGQISVADAAEYTATALTQFQLDGSEAAHVADLLAAGAGKAQGEVSDMALALNYAGVPASNLGVSIEETAGSIALLAKNGIVGEKAGTALRGMLGSLGSPSKIAAKEMENLGINVFDAKGNFIGFNGVAGQLQEKLAGLTQQEREQALGRIFGNEQAAAAGVFFREGAAGVDEMTRAVDDQGYAADAAAMKLDNLKGDVEKLMGSIETALIGAGSESQDSLRLTTQLATELVDVMSELNSSESDSPLWREALSQVDLSESLPYMNSAMMTQGLKNLRSTKEAIFGVDEATMDAAESDALLAAETTRLGQAAEFSADATQQSTEQLKVQADALEDARKAATDTAQGFVNLGDSLNDAKVSLGDWITQMANQADALNNFTSNAQKAAKNGLRDGLIAALKDSGTEGALRMKQLANATDAEIARANAAWLKGQKAIDRYVDATVKVPENVSTDLDVNGSKAAAKLIAFRNMLDETVRDRIMTITTQYKTVNSASDALPNRRREATGGFITGPGTTTSDSIPAWLSNREYVIQAAAVDHYGIGFFDSANAMRLAGGGPTSGKKKPKNVGVDNSPDDPAAEARERRKEAREEAAAQRQEQRDRIAEKRADAAEQDRQRLVEMEEDRIAKAEAIADAVLEGQQRAWDIATDAAQSQVDAAQDLVDKAVANMDRIGDVATAAFQSNWFDSPTAREHGLSVGDNPSATGDWRSRGTAEIADLKERGSLIEQLAGLGVTGGALEDLLGNTDNAGIADLIAKGEADDYAALFAEREKLLGTVSAQAGVAGYGRDLATAGTELVRVNEQLAELNEHIARARPITVLESISAAATAAELVRLLANY